MSDSILVELFLTEYFRCEHLAGNLVEDKSKLYLALSKSFLILPNDAKKMYEMMQSRNVLNIQCKEDYYRFARIKQYAKIASIVEHISAEEERMIHLKGNALLSLNKIDLQLGEPALARYERLISLANEGVTAVLRVLGILHCAEIIADYDRGQGLQYIEKNAKWNDIASILLSMHYDKSSISDNLSRLYTITDKTPQYSIYEIAKKKYGGQSDVISQETQLLEKLFSKGVVSKLKYCDSFARVIYSKIVNDKGNLLISSNKETLNLLEGLPLAMHLDEINYDEKVIKDLDVFQPRSIAEINRCLGNSKYRYLDGFKPTCFSADNSFAILDIYSNVIKKAIHTENIIRIDINKLGDDDLELTKYNVFVKNCDEHRSNIFLLVFQGKISAKILTRCADFLLSEKRKNISLRYPDVSLNFESIFPICFCDSANAQFLKTYCDMIQINSNDFVSKDVAMREVASQVAQKYGLSKVELEKSAKELLLNYSVDKILDSLDKTVRNNIASADGIVLSKEMITKTLCEVKSVKITYGFNKGGEDDK